MAAKEITLSDAQSPFGAIDTRTHSLRVRKWSLDTDLTTAKVVCPLPSRVPTLEAVRNTLVASSLEALRQRGLFDAYCELLPSQHHDLVLRTLAPTWLPLRVAVAHYEAIEGLGLHDDEALDMGRAVGPRLHGTFLATLLRSAKQAGFTPWSMMGKLDRFWSRAFAGGALGISMLGPREAIGHMRGVPLLELRYFRTALRGVVSAGLESMVNKCYVRELRSEITSAPESDGIDLVLSWV